MSNKKSGNDFEKEFCQMASKAGFWAHILKDGRNGQPADVIMAKNGIVALVDCKDCEKNIFPLSRIEGNQELSMWKWLQMGNKHAVFALKVFPEIRIIPFRSLYELKKSGEKQLDIIKIYQHSKSFNEWAEAFDAYHCQ